MSVLVQATGSLRSRIPAGISLDNVRTVGEAIERLQLPPTEGLAILVNGRLAHWTTRLKDGDTLQLIPALAGGQ